jgi:glycine amidinotransferase
MENSLKPILVNHEWGALKEAVVGYPHFRVGRSVPFWFRSYFPKEAIEIQENWIRNFSGQTIAEFEPALHHEQVKQVDAAIKILKDRGIIVHQVKLMRPDEERFLDNFESDSIQFFPRDPILIVGNTIIEMPLYAPFRRKERFAIRRTIGERISESDARVVSAPEPLPQHESEQTGYGPGPFLEGGDVFVLGRDIYVGNSGIASNKPGICWLQDCLGEDYVVHEVRLSRKFLHLDCVLCTPRPRSGDGVRAGLS